MWSDSNLQRPDLNTCTSMYILIKYKISIVQFLYYHGLVFTSPKRLASTVKMEKNTLLLISAHNDSGPLSYDQSVLYRQLAGPWHHLLSVKYVTFTNSSYYCKPRYIHTLFIDCELFY